jgi:dipeptidyl aminopeptidase/acylaminoacyl peptidase
MRRLAITLALVPSVLVAQTRVPSIDDLLNLKSLGAAVISPNGSSIAYIVNETDWKSDQFVSNLWLVNADGSGNRQLTRGTRNVGSPRWSPDGTWISFTSNRQGDTNQVFAIRPDGGESVQLTRSTSGGVGGYNWSPDGKTIAYTANDPASLSRTRRSTLGDWEVVRRDYQHSHLFTIDVAAALKDSATATQLTRGSDYTVNGFSWSPDGKRIAFAATINPDLINGGTSDVYVVDACHRNAVIPSGSEGSARCVVKKLVSQSGPDGNPVWSPDGRQIAFSTKMSREPYFITNNRIAVVSADGGTPRSLTDSFDEDASPTAWTRDGIWFTAWQKTDRHIYRLDPATGKVAQLTPAGHQSTGISPNADGSVLAVSSGSQSMLSELAVTPTKTFSPRKLTDFTAQTAGWNVGKREVVSWKSSDGATIEGVLVKPANFDSTKRYPLLVKIHGGPTGIDVPRFLAETRTYPVDLWVARGAIVLLPNYRGSAGYGEKFRMLNMKNLGVGDAWDVLSGVDALIARGFVDSTRMGSMGWSQGGYISAFLTTSSTRFKGISVGAGISDWATYYYNTDITPFTIQYLGADPVADPEVYRKTSPVSYVKGAKTPTLIQHGSNDRRVPIANAYQLRQALEDRGVPVEMVVYNGFGHGITRPKAQRAVMRHNLMWFNHYVFGDSMGDLRNPLGGAAPVQAGERQP